MRPLSGLVIEAPAPLRVEGTDPSTGRPVLQEGLRDGGPGKSHLRAYHPAPGGTSFPRRAPPAVVMDNTWTDNLPINAISRALGVHRRESGGGGGHGCRSAGILPNHPGNRGEWGFRSRQQHVVASSDVRGQWTAAQRAAHERRHRRVGIRHMAFTLGLREAHWQDKRTQHAPRHGSARASHLCPRPHHRATESR